MKCGKPAACAFAFLHDELLHCILAAIARGSGSCDVASGVRETRFPAASKFPTT